MKPETIILAGIPQIASTRDDDCAFCHLPARLTAVRSDTITLLLAYRVVSRRRSISAAFGEADMQRAAPPKPDL